MEYLSKHSMIKIDFKHLISVMSIPIFLKLCLIDTMLIVARLIWNALTKLSKILRGKMYDYKGYIFVSFH